jgi:hypothetical protein
LTFPRTRRNSGSKRGKNSILLRRHQNLEGDREPGHGLLIADALVGGQENIELAFGQGEPGRAGCFSRSLYGDVMTT